MVDFYVSDRHVRSAILIFLKLISKLHAAFSKNLLGNKTSTRARRAVVCPMFLYTYIFFKHGSRKERLCPYLTTLDTFAVR